MSTRSYICIKLRGEDKGKTLRCDVSKICPSYDESKFGDVELNGNYARVYSHFDGYPDGVGQVLVDNFNDYESALNLILGGGMSYPGVGTNWQPYVIRKGEPWDWNRPLITDEMPEAEEDYLYIFNLGRWWVKKYHGKDVVDLEAILRGEAEDPWNED